MVKRSRETHSDLTQLELPLTYTSQTPRHFPNESLSQLTLDDYLAADSAPYAPTETALEDLPPDIEVLTRINRDTDHCQTKIPTDKTVLAPRFTPQTLRLVSDMLRCGETVLTVPSQWTNGNIPKRVTATTSQIQGHLLQLATQAYFNKHQLIFDHSPAKLTKDLSSALSLENALLFYKKLNLAEAEQNWRLWIWLELKQYLTELENKLLTTKRNQAWLETDLLPILHEQLRFQQGNWLTLIEQVIEFLESVPDFSEYDTVELYNRLIIANYSLGKGHYFADLNRGLNENKMQVGFQSMAGFFALQRWTENGLPHVQAYQLRISSSHLSENDLNSPTTSRAEFMHYLILAAWLSQPLSPDDESNPQLQVRRRKTQNLFDRLKQVELFQVDPTSSLVTISPLTETVQQMTIGDFEQIMADIQKLIEFYIMYRGTFDLWPN